jgi:2-polyprenyl-6-methoxyphenol hydroxylase-like FAD-dependent oxidoreductase
MDVVVVGGGWCGLASALLLQQDGHRVTVLEKDAATVCAEPWDAWERPGVAQFRQPHLLMPRGRCILDEELPEVSAALLARRVGALNFLDVVPQLFPPDQSAAEDDRFRTYTARRPVLEAAIREVAENRLDIRRGERVAGLLATTGDRVPTVTGVALGSGAHLRADVVVDASGRKALGDDWLPAIGVPKPVRHAESDGFTYYSRFFRSSDGSTPALHGPLTIPYGSISILTLPADNGTWSVTIFVQSRDRQAKEVRHEAAWTSVVSACAAQAHWLDGIPTTDVLAIGGALDQRRELVDDTGAPTVYGYVTIGDAWSSTNPSLGRGLTMALMQAQRFRDIVRSELDPRQLAERWASTLATDFLPWYESAVATDHDRITEIDAIVNGLPAPPATDPITRLRLGATASGDPDLFRAMFDAGAMHALATDLLARPDIAAKLDALGPLSVAGSPFPGPDRTKFLELIG